MIDCYHLPLSIPIPLALPISPLIPLSLRCPLSLALRLRLKRRQRGPTSVFLGYRGYGLQHPVHGAREPISAQIIKPIRLKRPVHIAQCPLTLRHGGARDALERRVETLRLRELPVGVARGSDFDAVAAIARGTIGEDVEMARAVAGALARLLGVDLRGEAVDVFVEVILKVTVVIFWVKVRIVVFVVV